VEDQPIAINAKRGICEVELLLTKWIQGKTARYLVKERFSAGREYAGELEGHKTGARQKFEAGYYGNYLGMRVLDWRVWSSRVE
jgi:hypothetical protein